MIWTMIRRNILLYFRDKGMFFTSLITPGILLVLYVSFLGNVFRDTFRQVFEPYGGLPEELIEGCVGGQLTSSILAVCCVTVSFCANFIMVQDKAGGASRDFAVTPVSGNRLAFSYYCATLLNSLLVCLVACALCLGYVALTGWYLSFGDVCLILLDVVLLVFFGTALSSIINFFLNTQGQISAVGSIVSSCYGFVCGAYMPISQFAPGLQKVLACLPGTYGTALLRSHALDGTYREMRKLGIPETAIADMQKAMDCRIDFFDWSVSIPVMYGILVGTVLLLLGIYVLMNRKKSAK
ncbi:MAG: ABC transporter permease [Clostridia bacterium]|nr:ABC transporter permease [Clostridia bacterium]